MIQVRIPKWDQYQARNTRKNVIFAWIKVHRKLLQNPRFRTLSYMGRALLLDLWLAAETATGVIEQDDAESLAFVLRWDGGDLKDGLSELEGAGFVDISISESGTSQSESKPKSKKRREEKRREEKRKSPVNHASVTGDSRVSYSVEDIGLFETFWREYPKRAPNPKADARRNWVRLLAEGISPYELIRQASKYRRYIEGTGTENEYILQAASFLGPQRRGFEDDWEIPESEIVGSDILGTHDEEP